MRDVIRREAVDLRPSPGALSSHEQRGAPRFTLLIRAAKLVCPAGEFMCIVRDASESGVNIRVFHRLPDCGTMMLELQNGDRHELELVWQEDDRAGLRFMDDADISRIVESPSRFSKRPIRINLQAPALIESRAERAVVQIIDISQQGAKVSGDHHFSIDQRVRFSAQGLPEVNAKIRWRGDKTYGLVFEDTFQFGDLARIIARMQLGEAA